MKRNLIFYSRIILFILGFTGVYLEITRHGGLGMLMYYTVLSNIIVTAFTAYLLYLMPRSNTAWKTDKVLRIKGGVTMCIMITCVIYHFMLAPLATDFYRLENFLCHYIVPLCFFADTLVFDKGRVYRWFDPLLWTSIPLLYMVFALLNGLVLKLPIPGAVDSPFAYFFLNIPKYGSLYVFRWIVTIFLAYLAAGFVLVGIKSFSSFVKK
ncbi:Pr6Pr family membrane protein [Streptococcus pneumoniae]